MKKENSIYSNSHSAGKGDEPRNISKNYYDNFDKIKDMGKEKVKGGKFRKVYRSTTP